MFINSERSDHRTDLDPAPRAIGISRRGVRYFQPYPCVRVHPHRGPRPVADVTNRHRARAAFCLLGVALLWAPPAAAASPSAGSLPQTGAEPSFTTGLTTQMKTLWRAIEADSPSIGLPVFFPRGAYLQMKTGAILDPSADFSSRLVAFYDLDLGAYHRLIASSSPPVLLRVEVNPADAAWIRPGVCENKIGYWYLPGVRLVFKKGATIESVEVASLISWRGVWYVVHLGPNPRPRNVGTVDNFEVGAGVAGPAGGC